METCRPPSCIKPTAVEPPAPVVVVYRRHIPDLSIIGEKHLQMVLNDVLGHPVQANLGFCGGNSSAKDLAA